MQITPHLSSKTCFHACIWSPVHLFDLRPGPYLPLVWCTFQCHKGCKIQHRSCMPSHACVFPISRCKGFFLIALALVLGKRAGLLAGVGNRIFMVSESCLEGSFTCTIIFFCTQSCFNCGFIHHAFGHTMAI